jgi:hypothetical protein
LRRHFILSLTLQRRTIGERLDPTITQADKERVQYAIKGELTLASSAWHLRMQSDFEFVSFRGSDTVPFEAKWTSYALNIAIGLQVFLGALTTGLSAALSGRQVRLKARSSEFTTN